MRRIDEFNNSILYYPILHVWRISIFRRSLCQSINPDFVCQVYHLSRIPTVLLFLYLIYVSVRGFICFYVTNAGIVDALHRIAKKANDKLVSTIGINVLQKNFYN